MKKHGTALWHYVQQLSDLGVKELFFENMSAHNALALLRSTPVTHETHSGNDGAQEARSTGLNVLQEQASGCVRCRLHETRRTVVFGEGDPNAEVMVVGEAPGQEEDRTGKPFVGPAGKLLDLLLLTAGFPRRDVYICNVLKCRPPNNRNPLPDEVAHCSDYLLGQINSVAPRALIAVGKFAIQALLQTEESVGRLRGQIHAYSGKPMIVTYHPAYLLRSPQAVRVAWQDFQLLRQVLDEQH
ncbi:MAG: uracil-DNA glycosylase [Longimicrobiales bacterium]